MSPRRLSFFYLMTEAHDIKPDDLTFNTLIDACGKAGKLDKAFEMYNEMLERGLQPCPVTFNALIDASGRLNRLSSAIELMEELRRRNLKPDNYTYNTLISACCRNDDIGKAVQFLEEMPSDGVRPDAVTFNTLIDGWSRVAARGGFSRRQTATSGAWKIYEKMLEAKLVPSMITFTTLAKTCSFAQDCEGVTRLVSEVRTNRPRDVEPASTSVLCKALIGCGFLDEARAFLDDMIDLAPKGRGKDGRPIAAWSRIETAVSQALKDSSAA